MHIVIAMDKFAGTLTAPEAVRAVAEGWLRTSPEDTVTGVPMSDGGPGFLDALGDAFQGRVRFGERLATVSGPLGAEVTGRYLIELSGGRPATPRSRDTRPPTSRSPRRAGCTWCPPTSATPRPRPPTVSAS